MNILSKAIIILLGAAINMTVVSCRSHPKIVDFSSTFTVALHQKVQITPRSNLQIILLRLDQANSRAQFELLDRMQNSSQKEWVTKGEFFHSTPLVGVGGLKLEGLKQDSVVLRAFGAATK